MNRYYDREINPEIMRRLRPFLGVEDMRELGAAPTPLADLADVAGAE